MTENLNQTFEAELRNFFVLTPLNMVFAALALAIGMQSILITILGLHRGEPFTTLSLLMVLAGGAAIVVGLGWLLYIMKIFRPVKEVRKDYRTMEKPIADDNLTGLIVRMIANYRETKTTIRAMIFICVIGGLIYLALGIANVFQSVVWVISPESPGLGGFAFLTRG